VLLGDVLGFLEDRREIGFSHHSTEVRTRLRPSAGAEKLPVADGLAFTHNDWRPVIDTKDVAFASAVLFTDMRTHH
jgi:hypothetical protein